VPHIRQILGSAFNNKEAIVASFLLTGLAAIQEAQMIKGAFLTPSDLEADFGVALCDIKIDNILLDRQNRRLVYCTYGYRRPHLVNPV
jgi:serine/threonine protein kinase